jgi:hypothetical protein
MFRLSFTRLRNSYLVNSCFVSAMVLLLNDLLLAQQAGQQSREQDEGICAGQELEEGRVAVESSCANLQRSQNRLSISTKCGQDLGPRFLKSRN